MFLVQFVVLQVLQLNCKPHTLTNILTSSTSSLSMCVFKLLSFDLSHYDIYKLYKLYKLHKLYNLYKLYSKTNILTLARPPQQILNLPFQPCVSKPFQIEPIQQSTQFNIHIEVAYFYFHSSCTSCTVKQFSNIHIEGILLLPFCQS